MVKKPKHTLGDAPVEAQYRETMNRLARELDVSLNAGHMPLRRNGFVLLVFPFGSHAGRANYISNAERADIIVLLKEQLKRFEGMPEPKAGNA